jgi:hypothetical protein
VPRERLSRRWHDEGQKVAWRRSEGGMATIGRWIGDGRKVELRTEGEQTADGRWNPPTNFAYLVGDLLGMRNFTSARPSLPSVVTTFGLTDAEGCSDKRRTEGGTDRKISATSLEIDWV